MATRKLVVEVVGNADSLARTFRGASVEAQGLGGSLTKLSVGFGALAKSFIFIEVLQKAIQGLDDAIHIGISGFTDTTRVAAQTAAVIKSTGDVSNLSAKQIHALAAELSNVSGIDDEVIQSGENVLLSFTQIRDFAGKNNDIFTRATKVITDYASRTGKAVTASATIIGRALADPATKAVALSRAGIVLTKAQLGALKAIEKTSGVVAAQKVLLADLESRYKGAAAAAGKTLPGQLDILRERFKDLAGELVGDVVPAFSGTLKALTGFVVKLTETKGARAKFDVVVSGLDDIGSKIEAQFNKIDFKGIASRLGSKVGDALASVNWKGEIEKAGRAVGAALVATFNELTNVLDSVNWNRVGQAIVKGVGDAIGAAVVFLKSVNWRAVAASTLHLLVAAFEAQAHLLEGVGEAIGKALLKGLGEGLDSVGASLERKAIKIVLGVIDPFTSIPSFLGPEGGIARNIKSSLHATLAALDAPSAADGATVGQNFVAGILGVVAQTQGALSTALKSGISASQAAGAGSRNTAASASVPSSLPSVPLATVSQTKTKVDNSFTLPLRLQLEQAKAAASNSQAAILKAARDVRSFIQSQLSSLKGAKLVDAYNQLASVNGQIADAVQAAAAKAKAAADALKQFSVPLSLQVGEARLQALGESTTSVLKQIRAAAEKALKSGKLGLQGQLDAWNTIADVNNQLDQQGADVAKQIDYSKLAKKLGLAGDAARGLPEAIKAARGGGGKVGAFGVSVPATAGAGGGLTIMPSNVVVKIGEAEVGRAALNWKIGHDRRNPSQRRGPNAGN